MAIYLVTGTPGAGKTLNTIEAVHKRAQKESRAVYYANIKGITFDGWHEMQDHRESGIDLATAITPHSWYNAPDGSILLIDECQDFYPSVSANKIQPDYIMKMATHRHRGYDIYLITQGPNLINPKIKDWVTPHIHYRRLWGGDKTYRYTNEQVVNNIRDVRAIAQAAIREKVKLNRKYFDAYTSSVMHTQNRRYNIRIIAILAFSLLAIPLGIWYVYYGMHSINDNSAPQQIPIQQYEYKQGPIQDQYNPPQPASLTDRLISDTHANDFDPIRDYRPRIAAMPETAPAYDDLRRPQTIPKPQCLISKAKDTCACYTQQATVMHDYPDALCREYAMHGYFDPTRKDYEPPDPAERREAVEPVANPASSPLQGLILAQQSDMPKYIVRNDGMAIVPDPQR